MFRNKPPFKIETKIVNCMLINGGVGDHIGGSLIAIDYILKQYPWMELLIWTPDFLIDFIRNTLPNAKHVRGLSEMLTRYDEDLVTLNTQWDGRISPMKTHQTDYAFATLCDENPGIEHKNYLKVDFKRVSLRKFHDMPKKYVCIATGYTAAVREFSASTVNGVVDYVKGKGYEVVFLGQKQTPTGGTHVIEGAFSAEVDYSKGIDFRDRTSLLEAAKLIQGSAAMIGVDCGLIHLAGCTDAPIVAGYTTVTPNLRAPIRNSILGHNWYPVVPDESLGCRFCQARTNFLYGHDYRDCLYEDFECVKQLTIDKFVKELDKVL